MSSISAFNKSLPQGYKQLQRQGSPPVLFNPINNIPDANVRRVFSEENGIPQVPGTFLFLAVENKDKGITYPPHDPKFNIDKSILPFGAPLHVSAALEYLKAEREDKESSERLLHALLITQISKEGGTHFLNS